MGPWTIRSGVSQLVWSSVFPSLESDNWSVRISQPLFGHLSFVRNKSLTPSLNVI